MLQTLESRRLLSCTASFDAGNQLLTILGTAAADACVLSRDAAGNILLDGLATGATLQNTNVISISTGDSDDSITVDQSNGQFVKPSLDEIKIAYQSGRDNALSDAHNARVIDFEGAIPDSPYGMEYIAGYKDKITELRIRAA